jgi:hypothetical protein
MIQVYLPFADAVFSYDCTRCGAACCRTGGGFGLPREELAALGQRHPTLAYFARATGANDYLSVTAMGPRCLLLDEANRCTVHAELGPRSKPYVCRTFPVNQFLLLPELLVADLHPMCALRLDDGSGGTRLRHVEVLQGIDEHRTLVSRRAQRGPAGLTAADAAAIVEGEAPCRDLLAQHLGQDPLWCAAALHAGGATAARGVDAAPDGDLAAMRRYRQRLVDFLAAASHLGRTDRSALAGARRGLLAVFPRLRLRLAVGDLGRRYSEVRRSAPRMLVAADVLLELALGFAAVALDPSQIFDLLAESLPTLWMLAHLDAVPLVDPAALDSESVRLPASRALAVRQMLRLLHGHGGRRLTLAAAFDELGEQDALERLLLLRCLAERVAGRLRFETDPR